MDDSERTIVNMAIACCVSADTTVPKQERIDLLNLLSEKLPGMDGIEGAELEEYQKIIKKSIKILEAE